LEERKRKKEPDQFNEKKWQEVCPTSGLHYFEKKNDEIIKKL